MDPQLAWYDSELDLQDQVVADVGANLGKLSQFFWESGKGSNSVVSIEPLKQNIKSITKKIKKAKAKNWRIEPCAVSDCSGELQISPFFTREQGWNSSAVRAETAGNGEIVTIPCKTLDEIQPDATLVKIDIEGHEYPVIDQALHKLTAAKAWAVELHMMPNRPLGDVITQFLDHGYTVYTPSLSKTPQGIRWKTAKIPGTLQWERIPVAGRYDDGREFKMLHILAKR